MAKKARRKVSEIGLPPLNWDGYSWQGEVRLATWAGFQNCRGPYAARKAQPISDGTATLSIARESSDGESPPDAAQERAYRYLVSQEKAITDSVLQDIFDAYPEWREDYLDAVDEEAADDCPEITMPDELKALMGLSIVHVLTESRDGIAYVGFEFACEWEGEHGLGVMTHGDRVVATGHADHAFLGWIARGDAEKQS